MRREIIKRAKITAKTPEAKRNNQVSKVQKSAFSRFIISPIDQILYFQKTIGNQAVQRLINQSGKEKERKFSMEAYYSKSDRGKAEAAGRVVTGTEPIKILGFTNDDIQSTVDMERVRRALKNSKTFNRCLKYLADKNVRVIVEVGELPAKAGGGRCKGSGNLYGIVIDPEDIEPGIHVVDIYIHEFGHAWEEHGGPSADYFTNQIQKEMGIRQTRPTHTPLSTPRDIFAPPGSRENPIF